MARRVAVAVIAADGRRYWFTSEAVAQLGIRRARLGDWVRRSKVAGHIARAAPDDCPACGSARFPHVDPPRRAAGLAGYLAEQLLEAEAYTFRSRRGGASRSVT
jgi:hypothetical protein